MVIFTSYVCLPESNCYLVLGPMHRQLLTVQQFRRLKQGVVGKTLLQNDGQERVAHILHGPGPQAKWGIPSRHHGCFKYYWHSLMMSNDLDPMTLGTSSKCMLLKWLTAWCFGTWISCFSSVGMTSSYFFQRGRVQPPTSWSMGWQKREKS